MKKCGLRKAYALGGLIEQTGDSPLMAGYKDRMAQLEKAGPGASVGILGDSTDADNAEKSARWQLQDLDKMAGATAGRHISPLQAQGMRSMLTNGLGEYARRFGTSNLDQIVGFKNGGKVGVDQEGFIKGPGGVDNVPARVAETGEEIRVGAGERIVNKDQNEALEELAEANGVDLDDYLARATGKPVGPTMKKGLRGLNMGGFVDDFGNLNEPNKFQGGNNRAVLQQQIAAAAPEAQAAPTGAIQKSGFQSPVDTSQYDNEVRGRAAANRARIPSAPVAQPASSPAPVAPKPTGVLGGLRGFLTHPATLAPLILQGGAAAINAIDSIPSLRGRATADDMNMSLSDTDREHAVADGLKARDIAWEKQHGKTLDPSMKTGYVADPSAQPAPSTSTGPLPVSDPSYDRKEFRAAAGGVAANQELSNPDIRGLRAAGVTGIVGGDDTVDGKTAATGIRTINTPNGKVYAGRSPNGQLNVNFNSGKTADEADAARDAEFAAKGYGKDAYGNWMTPQRVADAQYLEKLQRDRAKFDAFDPSITDSGVQQAGLRRVMYDTANDQYAAKMANERAKTQLDLAKFGLDVEKHKLEGRKVDQLQGNNERDFKDKGLADNIKALDALIENHYPTAGLKDKELAAAMAQQARARESILAGFGGNVPSDRNQFRAAMFPMLKQEQATRRLRDTLQDQGLWDRFVRNSGQRPALTNQNLDPQSYDKDSDMLTMPDGYRVKGKEIWGQDADIRDAVLGRITLRNQQR